MLLRTSYTYGSTTEKGYLITIERQVQMRQNWIASRNASLLEVQLNQEKIKSDRRGADRFPIMREVRYKVLNKKNADEAGSGKTLNMSSKGVLFTSEQMLLPGKRMELAINWPAQLNNQTPLKLVARGRVVRYDDGRAAMEIQQYEFRTSAVQSLMAQ